MVETPNRRQPRLPPRDTPRRGCAASPLRASLGINPVDLETRAGVYVMIETAAALLTAVAEICAVPGLSGVYVGPADLAISLGHGLAR